MEGGLKGKEKYGANTPRLPVRAPPGSPSLDRPTYWVRHTLRLVWEGALPWSGMYRTCASRKDAPRPRREPSSPPWCTQHRHPLKRHLSLRPLLRKIDWFSWTLLERPRKKGEKVTLSYHLDLHSLKGWQSSWGNLCLVRNEVSFSTALASPSLRQNRALHWFRISPNTFRLFAPFKGLHESAVRLDGLFSVPEKFCLKKYALSALGPKWVYNKNSHRPSAYWRQQEQVVERTHHCKWAQNLILSVT